jgi:DtxR family Mn-dependent transcriptional regulator
MLKKLRDNDLIFYEKYGGVTLKSEGEELAKVVKHRHDTLKKLLKIIFVPEDVAERDACKLEHNLSPESINQLTNFVNFIESRPIHPQWLEHFKTFCETGEYECEKIE